MTVYLKLAGPNTKGLKPKGCYTNGWNLPDYKGVDYPYGAEDDWIGLRLDDRVVIDCDCEEALLAWLGHIGLPLQHTRVRKTPHGYHLLYGSAPGIDGRRLMPAIHPLMELKAGHTQQIVYYAPGYNELYPDLALRPFDPAWLPEVVHGDRGIEEWSEMPDGIGDNAMISFAGKFREWGMDEETIFACLSEINFLTMTIDPMPKRTIKRLARQAAKYETGEHEAIETECPACGEKWEIR